MDNKLKVSDLLEFAKHVSPTTSFYVRDQKGIYLDVSKIVLEKEVERADQVDLVIEVEV